MIDERGITGYRIMKDLHIPQGTISQARHNKASFTVSQLIQISEYLNVSLDWLLTGKTPETNSEKRITELTKENAELKSKIKKVDNTIAVYDKIKDIVYKAK